MALGDLGDWGGGLLLVAVAIVCSWAGGELVRWWGARRLDALRGQHWTEQARVFAEINGATRAFRVCFLSAAVVWAAMSRQGVRTTEVVRFGAAATAVIILLGDPLLGRWARRATAGALAPLSWSEVQRLALVLFPSRIVLLGFATLQPLRYDLYGCCWAATFLFTLTLSHAGGAAVLMRALGGFRQARASLQQLTEQASRAAGVTHVRVYELTFARANAFALPLPKWILFTTGALDGLEPAQLEAILAHELGHLREPLRVKWLRVAGGSLLFLPLGLIPTFPRQPAYGFIVGCVALVVGSLLLRNLSRRLEQRADALAQAHVGDTGLYARALERLYQLNWAPAVVRGQQHPSLYDRMQKSGVAPDYPRPRTPARGPVFVASALGFVAAFIVNVVFTFMQP